MRIGGGEKSDGGNGGGGGSGVHVSGGWDAVGVVGESCWVKN